MGRLYRNSKARMNSGLKDVFERLGSSEEYWVECIRCHQWEVVWRPTSSASPPLHFGETDPLPFDLPGATSGSLKNRALNRRGNSATDSLTVKATDKAIEPAIVGTFGSHFPFVNGSPATFGFNPVLGSQVFRDQSMLFGAIAER